MISWRRLPRPRKSASRIMQTYSQGEKRDGVHDDHAGRHSQHEARGDGQHVHDDDVLQPEGVGDHHQPGSRRGSRARTPASCPIDAAPRQTADDDDNRGSDCEARIERAGRQRSIALLRVQPVLGHVDQVVDDVDRARDQAEQDEGREGPQKRADLKQLDVEDQRGPHEDVLRPLFWPHRLEQERKLGALANVGGGCRGRFTHD